MRVAATKCGARQFFRRLAVRFGQQRTNILRLVLPFEAVDEIFGRELIGRIPFFAKQIVDGVIVLAVRQAAQNRSRLR